MSPSTNVPPGLPEPALPMRCAWCRALRTADGSWTSEPAEAVLWLAQPTVVAAASHGACPPCARKWLQEYRDARRRDRAGVWMLPRHEPGA